MFTELQTSFAQKNHPNLFFHSPSSKMKKNVYKKLLFQKRARSQRPSSANSLRHSEKAFSQDSLHQRERAASRIEIHIDNTNVKQVI